MLYEVITSSESLSDAPAPIEALDLPRLTDLRQRMIGALLRQERMNASLSMKTLAEQTGISSRRLKQYELGERPIPLPELEIILKVLGGRIETFFDQGGPIGQWMSQQKARITSYNVCYTKLLRVDILCADG